MERLAHLLELQQQHLYNIQHLEKQASRHGSDVPLHIINELDAERERLAKVQADLTAPVPPDELNKLKTNNDIALVLQELRFTRQHIREKIDRDYEEYLKQNEQLRIEFNRELLQLRTEISREAMKRFWSIAGLGACLALVLVAGFVYILLDRFIGAGLMYLAPTLLRELLWSVPTRSYERMR